MYVYIYVYVYVCMYVCTMYVSVCVWGGGSVPFCMCNFLDRRKRRNAFVT